jgi:hypothetical protein
MGIIVVSMTLETAFSVASAGAVRAYGLRDLLAVDEPLEIPPTNPNPRRIANLDAWNGAVFLEGEVSQARVGHATFRLTLL